MRRGSGQHSQDTEPETKGMDTKLNLITRRVKADRSCKFNNLTILMNLMGDFGRTQPWKGYADGYVYSSPVGSFKPNELGIYDICGNVYEWCWDWMNDNYYSFSPENNPDGPAKGEKRVCRNVGSACQKLLLLR